MAGWNADDLAGVLALGLAAGRDEAYLFEITIRQAIDERGLRAVGPMAWGMVEKLEASPVSSPPVRELARRWRERIVLLLGALGRDS